MILWCAWTARNGLTSRLVLSVCLLFTAIALCMLGIVGLYSGKDAPWLTTALTWIGNGFLFTAGIAVGKSGRDKTDAPEHHEH
jgi:arginine exporter protein ArgO